MENLGHVVLRMNEIRSSTLCCCKIFLKYSLLTFENIRVRESLCQILVPLVLLFLSFVQQNHSWSWRQPTYSKLLPGSEAAYAYTEGSSGCTYCFRLSNLPFFIFRFPLRSYP